jgi:hypothetical protein
MALLDPASHRDLLYQVFDLPGLRARRSSFDIGIRLNQQAYKTHAEA